MNFKLDAKGRALVRKEVNRLNDDERRAIYLTFWQNASLRETARELQVSEKKAERILKTALEVLRERFKRNRRGVYETFKKPRRET